MINVTKSDLPPLEEYVEYLRRIWTSRWLTNNGEYEQLFQKELERYLKVEKLVLVTNGTLAIELALKALNIGGEVITTPFTFPATTNMILWEGLTPVFADIDPDTFNIDPKKVEERITDRTSAILAVHVYGNPCYVEDLEQIASSHGLKLIYDAAHAFGVEYKNRSVLNYGDISTLSFHATKVFNTIEGGAIVAKDQELLEKLNLLRNHGIKSEEQVVLAGTNAKMNEFQAIMGLCNLRYIDQKIENRRRLYEYYEKRLGRYVRFQKIIASKYNYIYMPVYFGAFGKRDDIYQKLVEKGIKPRKYFYPLTTNSDYFVKKGLDLVKVYDLKNASKVSDRILCLPLYPDLDITSVDEVIGTIEQAMQ